MTNFAMSSKADASNAAWPELSYPRDHETFETLHLMAQIAGKVRLALTPWINHSWQVPLYMSARGLQTSLIPHPSAPFDLEFDLIKGRLVLRTSAGVEAALSLRLGTIASFYAGVMDMLQSSGVPVKIFPAPNELPEQIPFPEDTRPRAYDGDAAHRLWLALAKSAKVFQRFRSAFLGKVSPVHFFWGSFDLAVTRFSGRRAPAHPGGVPHLPDDVAREAYSHEVSSAGFWPGGPNKPFPMYYSYAYPEPKGFRSARVKPDAAFFSEALGEFILPYDAVRTAPDPDQALLAFLQSSYEAAANAAKWDRGALECEPGKPGVVRQI